MQQSARPGASPLPSFADIRDLIGKLPGPDEQARTKTALRERDLTKPAGALGRLEVLSEWLAAWQGRTPPVVDRPRVAVFAGNHGVADAHQVSAFPTSVTAQMVANFRAGGAAVNQLTALIDGDLRVYEMALDRPTADFTAEPAMSEQDCAVAISYGMMAVEDDIDVLCVGEMGIGNTTSAAALCHALFGGEAEKWTGPGTGVQGAALDAKTAVVRRGVERHADLDDPLQVLAALGGQELAAILGAVLAARLARTPVLLDGYATTAAAAVLWKIHPGLLDHCLVAHLSAEPAHARLCEIIGQRPLLDLEMRLGEASGAALAVNLLRAAVTCHSGMATFDSAGVDRKD